MMGVVESCAGYRAGIGQLRSSKPPENRRSNDRSQGTADVARRPFAESKSPKRSINEFVVPAGIEGLSNVGSSRERTGAPDLFR